MNPKPVPCAKSPASRLRLLAIACLPFVFASCEEAELFYLINPDGSGRVSTKERILTSQAEIEGKDALEQVAIGTLAEFVLRSKGIDAWEKVSYNITAEGDVVVAATALFSDLSKLELSTTAPAGGLAGGLKYVGAEGDRPASIQLRSPIAAAPPQEKPKEGPPTPEGIQAELTKTRETWGEAEKDMRLFMGKKHAKLTFHLPGPIAAASNFKKDAENQVSLEVTATGMIDTLSKLIADDKLATEILKTGAKIMANEGAPPIAPERFNLLAFGEEKPIRVDFKPVGRMFDYRDAVEKARANPSELLQRVTQLAEDAK